MSMEPSFLCTLSIYFSYTVSAEILTVTLIRRFGNNDVKIAKLIYMCHYRSICTTSMGFSPYFTEIRQFKNLPTASSEQTAKYNVHLHFCLYDTKVYIRHIGVYTYLLHIIPVSNNSTLNGIIQQPSKNATFLLSCTTNIKIFLPPTPSMASW